MKTIGVIVLGLIAIVALVVLVVMEILELIFGAVFIFLIVVLMFWLYNKMKNKLN